MKITYYAHTVLSRGGDKMILAHLAYLAGTGHQVVIDAGLVKTVFDIHPAIQVKKIAGCSKSSSILCALWGRKDADIVIASIIPMACFLALRNPGRVVYFAQDYDESYYSQSHLRLLVRCFYILGLRWLKIPVIAVAHHLKETLSRRYNANVSVVTNGVDLNVFFPDPDKGLVKQKEDRKAVLVLARSDWRKGFDLAQSVLRRVNDETEVSFEVWSVGEDSPGCFEGMIYRDFGYVREEELRRIISSADVFLYPSRHEGFPLMALETLACGCAMVTTDAVSVVRHKKEALVCPIEDVSSLSANLTLLLDNDSLRESLVAAGMKFASNHSLKDSCRNFADELSRMLLSR